MLQKNGTIIFFPQKVLIFAGDNVIYCSFLNLCCIFRHFYAPFRHVRPSASSNFPPSGHVRVIFHDARACPSVNAPSSPSRSSSSNPSPTFFPYSASSLRPNKCRALHQHKHRWQPILSLRHSTVAIINCQ